MKNTDQITASSQPVPPADPPAEKLNLSETEVLILKIAELVLNRDMVESAARPLLANALPVGKSGLQKRVLAKDLFELTRRCDGAMTVKWPKLIATKPT